VSSSAFPVVGLALAAGAFLRLWQINSLGFNTDEAVYAGQAAAIAGDEVLQQLFPIFRAHPILFQTLLSVAFQAGVSDLTGRVVAAAVGVATVYLTYLLGRELYGERAGQLAALFLALMPYHVVVTRQVLLDGPMAFFSTLTLYCLARFAGSQRRTWLYAAGACVGLTFLSKTNGIVILGGAYAFFALSPSIRVRLRDLALAIGCTLLLIAPYPLTLSLAGQTETGRNYAAWQLFRRPNHDWSFYLTTVPEAIGLLLILLALAWLWLSRRELSWRETLLWSWIVVPAAFFQVWPTKGFQYLLTLAPAFAILAAATISHWRSALQHLLTGVTALTLVVPTWQRIQPAQSDVFLAGSGGVPGGREAGWWVNEHVPEGGQLLAIGPSMANIIQFYGQRKTYGLSVSPNPLRRNPSYEPVNNPDLLIRDNQLHYLVWDAFSASRSPLFSDGLLRYVDKYHGRVAHLETVPVKTSAGHVADKPVVVIYAVRP
jgi:4-amino-4-deoxy-L-arabinose transferase-like glycosyltransferase